MYHAALVILNKLKEKGYEAYIVGGYPRDKYLGIDTFDIDICTNARPEEVSQLFKVEKQLSKFGVSIIKEENYSFEVTTYRKDI